MDRTMSPPALRADGRRRGRLLHRSISSSGKSDDRRGCAIVSTRIGMPPVSRKLGPELELQPLTKKKKKTTMSARRCRYDLAPAPSGALPRLSASRFRSGRGSTPIVVHQCRTWVVVVLASGDAPAACKTDSLDRGPRDTVDFDRKHPRRRTRMKW